MKPEDLILFTVGDLFAVCPVDAFPGVAVEPVSDSSRYFVLRLQDQGGNDISTVECSWVEVC